MAKANATRVCLKCGQGMKGYPSKALYCSPSCKVCTVERCSAVVLAKGLCNNHYKRRADGRPEWDACIECDSTMYGAGNGTLYCSDECKQCKVDGCKYLKDTGGLCQKHMFRMKKWGRLQSKCGGCGKMLPGDRGHSKYCDDDCKPRCIVEGCKSARVRSSGRCHKHEVNMERHGAPIGSRVITEKADKYVCVVCNCEFSESPIGRKYCSSRCANLSYLYGETIPSLDFECASCHTLVERNRFEDRSLQPHRSYCDDCQKRPNKGHLYFRGEILSQGRAECGICHEKIDLTLEYPNPGYLTIDHILPLSLGGGDERENLRAAHMGCNSRRGNRIEEPIQLALQLSP